MRSSSLNGFKRCCFFFVLQTKWWPDKNQNGFPKLSEVGYLWLLPYVLPVVTLGWEFYSWPVQRSEVGDLHLGDQLRVTWVRSWYICWCWWYKTIIHASQAPKRKCCPKKTSTSIKKGIFTTKLSWWTIGYYFLKRVRPPSLQYPPMLPQVSTEKKNPTRLPQLMANLKLPPPNVQPPQKWGLNSWPYLRETNGFS